ncbi:MAG: hypothetical protein WA624_06180 [Methylocella sp.]
MATPRGDKSKYTGQQERKANHIAESYESRGVPEKEVERRAMSENYLLCRLLVGLTETPRLRSMNTLRILIVEDEPLAAIVLEAIVNEIVTTAGCGKRQDV